MASAGLIALIGALAVLAISVLWVFQRFESSATRSKVNRAAIGSMTKKNKYSWDVREWKPRITYAHIDSHAIMTALKDKYRSAESEFLEKLPDHSFKWVSDGAGRPVGLAVVHHEDGFQMPLQISKFTREQQHVIANLQNCMNICEYVPPCKASWCNMMIDLGIDPGKFPIKDTEYLDAHAIPSTLEAPMIHMKMSDVVLFGFLLDMEICRCEVKTLAIDMVGNDCNITTQHHNAAGMISRYSGVAPSTRATALRCTPPEISMLLRTAAGHLTIGDTALDMLVPGYNIIDYIFSEVVDHLETDNWQKVSITKIIDKAESDAAFHPPGKWVSPRVPIVPFLLAHCGNLSVANAFPHRNLESWYEKQRCLASTNAYRCIQETVHFINAPLDLYKMMRDEELDFVSMNHLKIANNWGCEDGGMRSWLAGNLSEFTHRMSRCWEVSDVTEHVPLLSHLQPFLCDGTLNVNTVRLQISRPGQAPGSSWWWRNSPSMLWLQIMMFDTWIARRVERIMGKEDPVDLSVPAPLPRAGEWVEKEGGISKTGWKRSRLMFARAYLKRLAEGRDGRSSSFMAAPRLSGVSTPWMGMPYGQASDWAEVDAVLTLRAVVMVVRLELMKDSSILLDLRQMDPMVQMA